MNTHKPIVVRFWDKSGVNSLCVGWAQVSLVSPQWSSLKRTNGRYQSYSSV